MFILENIRDCSIIKYKSYIQLYPEITTINIFCVSLMYPVYCFVIKVFCMLLQVLNNFSIVIFHVIFLFSHSIVVGQFLLPIFCYYGITGQKIFFFGHKIFAEYLEMQCLSSKIAISEQEKRHFTVSISVRKNLFFGDPSGNRTHDTTVKG